MQYAEGLILLETKGKYAIWEKCRCGLVSREIWGFSKLEDMYYYLSLMSNHES
jgi:hypothetical protein